MNRSLVTLASVLTFALAVPAHAADSPDELFKKANQSFATGARAAASDPSRASPDLAAAVAGYKQLIEGNALHSAALHYNLANAQFLSGDVGRAVASYRRAQRLDASLPGLKKNLDNARAKVAFKESSAGNGASGGATAASAASDAFAWHTAIPQALRLWIGVGAFALVWVLLLARLRRGDSINPPAFRPPLWTPIAAAGVAGLMAGSLWWQDRAERATPAAVVVAERVVGRKGPDALSYQPSFTEPLRAGFEVTVLETRGEWLSVKLQDGRVTWVPAGSVELL
jgi:hypothetical protein